MTLEQNIKVQQQTWKSLIKAVIITCKHFSRSFFPSVHRIVGDQFGSWWNKSRLIFILYVWFNHVGPWRRCELHWGTFKWISTIDTQHTEEPAQTEPSMNWSFWVDPDWRIKHSCGFMQISYGASGQTAEITMALHCMAVALLNTGSIPHSVDVGGNPP